MEKEWENKKDTFKVVDVRKLTGNFLPMILKKAGEVEIGNGLCIVQSFEPIPLYSAMSELGFDHITNKVSDTEYKVYFCKTKNTTDNKDMPLKPTAILNLKKIDNSLADISVNFWTLIWGQEKSSIDQKTKLLLSLANGVGAGRYRQAARELVKAYSIGVTIAELDELFSLFVWNQGVGNFASEIGPSALFGAYQLIKNMENKGESREDITKALLEKFGEDNPDVGTLHN
jgi:alkylhydroperoxidase/carboxymuconolactone decarboxylase family protein YurZ